MDYRYKDHMGDKLAQLASDADDAGFPQVANLIQALRYVDPDKTVLVVKLHGLDEDVEVRELPVQIEQTITAVILSDAVYAPLPEEVTVLHRPVSPITPELTEYLQDLGVI